MTTAVGSEQERKVVEGVEKRLYIGGEWRDVAKGTLAVEDPATGEALCEVADASEEDAKAALDAAVATGPARPPCASRSRISKRKRR